MSSNKDRAKLAANVTRMITALKQKVSPTESPLALPQQAASQSRSVSNGSSSSAFRTPSRDRYSTPGGQSQSSLEDGPIDTKSYNRSRRGSDGDAASQASLDFANDDHVFSQGGFGVQNTSARGEYHRTSKDAAGKPIKPQPRPRGSDSGPTSEPVLGTSSVSTASDRRTPRRRSSDKEKGQGDSRSEAAPANDAARRSTTQPKKEERYAPDPTREAEPSRKSQLSEGRSADARRSAPRRHESPGAALTSSGGTDRGEERSRSTQRRMQDAARAAARGGGEGGSKPHRSSRDDRPSAGGLGTSTSTTSSVQTPPTAASSLPAPISAATTTTATTTGDGSPRISSPAIGIRRKNSSTQQQPKSSPATTGPSALPTNNTGASTTPRAGLLGTAAGVTKAIAALSANTTRTLMAQAESGSRSPRQAAATGASARTLTPRRDNTKSPGSAPFSLADFVRETSSQYDFNRAPSRLSMGGGSQYDDTASRGGGGSGGATPVQIRSATLLDSISEPQFPSKPPLTTTAGMIDASWLDGTAKQTTSGGLERTEKGIRLRIQHAAFFRPRVWFMNNVLPMLRQTMLRDYASRKRKLFVTCAEPNFREVLVGQYYHELSLIRCCREEDIDRMDLGRATLLWRTQVKSAFDRLFQQLRVEMQRKVEVVAKAVEQDIVKGANALAEKTSFSYLHLHERFGDGLLRRTKELYIYYFGIIVSTSLKEEKGRASIASDQRFARLWIELDRIRFFIQHLELVEYENILKYFGGEKRILESELRFRPNRSLNATPAPGGTHPSNRSAAGSAVAAQKVTTAPTPTVKQSTTTLVPQQQQQQQLPYPSYASSQPSSTVPFPLDVLERQQLQRTSATTTPLQQQRQHQQELIDREMASSLPTRATAAARNPQEAFLPTSRQLESQLQQGDYYHHASSAVPAQHHAPHQYQNSSSAAPSQPSSTAAAYQQVHPLAQWKSDNLLLPSVSATAASTTAAQPNALSSGTTLPPISGQPSFQSTPYATAANGQPDYRLRRPLTMGVEDRRKASEDEEDQPLPPNPVRAGHLLPKIDPVARKARETAEGVVNGLVVVSRLLQSDTAGSSNSGRSVAPSSVTASASAMGSRLLPPLGAASASVTPAVAAIGRMLLGPTRSQSLQEATPDALGEIPDDAIDDREVWRTELATAVGLLLLLHKGGADTITDDEASVRRSLMVYAREDRQEAANRAATNRADRFFLTRLNKLTVEEQEMRLALWQHQCHEFMVHVQRLQWVEYFLFTSEESSERERLVGMSHLSRAIIAKNNKQEFAVTCVMQHQVLSLQQWHLYQRWFLSDVEFLTSRGNRVEQMERRERNKLAVQMEKESRWLRDDARDRYTMRAALLSQPTASSGSPSSSVPQGNSANGVRGTLGSVEAEALAAVEDVHRRNIARQFTDSFQRFIVENWEEPMHRGVIRIARERWFRDLVRPSQHRVQITISEDASRGDVRRQESLARRLLCEQLLCAHYEAAFQEVSMNEQRDFRRLTLMCLKERRQREARQRESFEKREQMQRYLQNAIVGTAAQMAAAASPSKHPVLEDALNRYMAATATSDTVSNTRSATQTPIADYSVMMRVKQQQHQLHVAQRAISPTAFGK